MSKNPSLPTWRLVPAFLALLLGAGPAAAASLNVSLRAGEKDNEALKDHPVMISVIKDGQVAAQKEVALGYSPGFNLEPGLYDVRLEGDGMVTLVKRGIHVFEGKSTDIIGGPMQAGKGVRIVEFATGGLSREEVAARLARLDSEVAELRKEIKKPAK
jgi:hypothetical protein